MDVVSFNSITECIVAIPIFSGCGETHLNGIIIICNRILFSFVSLDDRTQRCFHNQGRNLNDVTICNNVCNYISFEGRMQRCHSAFSPNQKTCSFISFTDSIMQRCHSDFSSDLGKNWDDVAICNHECRIVSVYDRIQLCHSDFSPHLRKKS